MNDDWATPTSLEPCKPCVGVYGDEGARAGLAYPPTPEELVQQGAAALARIQAIAAVTA